MKREPDPDTSPLHIALRRPYVITELDRKTATPVQPETRPVPKYEFLTIIGTILALGALLLTTTGRIEARLDGAIAEAGADRRAFEAKMDEFRAQAAADRRASETKMDEFRNRMDEYRGHMQRLGERQARVEGQHEADPER